MSENYSKLARPPITALRTITAGDLKGKSDINPQWRYEIMDEVYGACGIGWRYEIVRTWEYPCQDGTILCFAQVNVFTKTADGWSDPVPGIGGNTLLDMVNIYGADKRPTGEKRPKPNDEGFKMAVTDALSTALKMIGVAADVYRGNWDGTKYRDLPEKKAEKADPDRERCIKAHNILKMTPEQLVEAKEKNGGSYKKTAEYLEGLIADKEAQEAQNG